MDGIAPFLEYVGVEVVYAEGDRAKARLPSRKEVANSGGSVHGSAVASVLNGAMVFAFRSLEPTPKGVLVSMTVNLLSGCGGDLMADAVIERCGSSLAFASASVVDDENVTVATGSGIFSVRR